MIISLFMIFVNIFIKLTQKEVKYVSLSNKNKTTGSETVGMFPKTG